MILLSILISIGAIALPSINNNIYSIFYKRINSIIFLYFGAFFNAFFIQSIGSEISIYSDLFYVTINSQSDIIIIAFLLLNSTQLLYLSYKNEKL